MFLSHTLYKSGMFTSIRVDTALTKNNQNISTESSNEYLLDPFGELINTISSCSAVGLPSFIAHKAKTSLSLTLESLGNTYLIDIRTLLYIITLVGAITSIRLSISSYQSSIYILDKSYLIIPPHSRKSNLYQISGFILTIFSIIIPLYIYNIINSQIIVQ